MGNEIKVGDWIRTNWGHIGNLKRIELDKNDEGLKWYVFDHKEFEINIVKEEYINKPYIVKHSLNLIDLICEGDYVNGAKVTEIKEWKSLKDGYFRYTVTCHHEIIRADEIKTIVTKEMMESISYKVKQEEK